MDPTMEQFKENLIEIETEAENLLLARQQMIENDKVRNGNREALTALGKRARTTKTSVHSPFDSTMKEIEGIGLKPLVKEVCATCGNHDFTEKTWINKQRFQHVAKIFSLTEQHFQESEMCYNCC